MTENIAFKLAESFTEKNSQLAELRVVVDACPLATFVSDSAGECVYVNQAYQALVGRPYRACLESRWKAFIHPDDLDEAMTAWHDRVITAEVYDHEYRVVRPGGETIPVHVRAVPLPSGGFVGYLNATDGLHCPFTCSARRAGCQQLVAA